MKSNRCFASIGTSASSRNWGKASNYVGEADLERKNELLSRARALLFPIEWQEPFGLAMIEAMACGTPVLAFEGGSVEEIVHDGVNGWICADAADMARADRVARRPGGIVPRLRRATFFAGPHGRSLPRRLRPRDERVRARRRNSPWCNSICIRTAMHPRWLRCSSFKYSRYSQSSRLAIGAPRRSRCDDGVAPRAANGRHHPGPGPVLHPGDGLARRRAHRCPAARRHVRRVRSARRHRRRSARASRACITKGRATCRASGCG